MTVFVFFVNMATITGTMKTGTLYPPVLYATLWLALYFAVLVWSAIEPKDRFIWTLEVSPAWIALLIMVASYRRFPLTPLTYWLILVHCIILMVGGHYTYAEVPFFDGLGGWFGGGRNNYDKVGHFAQGFVPAIIAREILIRFFVVSMRSWLNFLVVSICLAVSAFYELVEWWVAVLGGESAEAFLGTQGYSWDTQTDMFMALVGAVTAIILLGAVHDRQLSNLHSMNETGPSG